MQQTNRRIFLIHTAAAGSALTAVQAHAQAPAARVDEKDPQAMALGYVHDTTKADGKKFPKHTKDQKCANCQVFGGKPADAWGPCAIFPGKQVAGPGWCSAWVKKA